MITDLNDIAPENPDLGALRFMVADYFATGEGRTVSILICTMHPLDEEWERKPNFELGDPDRPAQFYPGKLNRMPREILSRQFSEIFGTWLVRGVEFIDWEKMKKDYAVYLPPMLAERVEKRDCNLHFQTQLHLNFS